MDQGLCLWRPQVPEEEMHVSLNTSGTGWDVRAKEEVVW